MKNKEELGLERILFFSDAVIAITLLVLDLRLPEHSGEALAVQLRDLGSKYLSFFVSFTVIGLFGRPTIDFSTASSATTEL